MNSLENLIESKTNIFLIVIFNPWANHIDHRNEKRVKLKTEVNSFLLIDIFEQMFKLNKSLLEISKTPPLFTLIANFLSIALTKCLSNLDQRIFNHYYIF